jgi:hypothetical protein
MLRKTTLLALVSFITVYVHARNLVVTVDGTGSPQEDTLSFRQVNELTGVIVLDISMPFVSGQKKHYTVPTTRAGLYWIDIVPFLASANDSITITGSEQKLSYQVTSAS